MIFHANKSFPTCFVDANWILGACSDRKQNRGCMCLQGEFPQISLVRKMAIEDEKTGNDCSKQLLNV